MLRSVQFQRDYRMFKKGQRFDFLSDTPNLLVGDQGTGKTSLLEVIGDPERFAETVTYDSDSRDVLMLDAAALVGEQEGQSQGQFLLKQLEALATTESVLWLLDGPDTWLSIRSAYRVVELMQMAVLKGSQVIAAVHSPVMIRSVRQVLSLEHGKWVYPTDFVNDHTPGSARHSSARLRRPQLFPR